jgi:hypothetical protein
MLQYDIDRKSDTQRHRDTETHTSTRVLQYDRLKGSDKDTV